MACSSMDYPCLLADTQVLEVSATGNLEVIATPRKLASTDFAMGELLLHRHSLWMDLNSPIFAMELEASCGL